MIQKWFDEKMNKELSYVTENRLDSSNKVQKISMMMNHHVDVVFYIRLIQIFIEICGHQSSNWFNNSVKLPPFSNDLDKNLPKYVIFVTYHISREVY